MLPRFAAKIRNYRQFGGSSEQEGVATTMVSPDNAVAQISLLPGGDGFLIRVWPPNGTAEYGGTNITAMSAVARVTTEYGIVIESIHSEPRAERGRLDSLKVERLVRDDL